MATSRRILFLTPAWPVEPGFGGQLRALHVARALQQFGTVTVMVVGSEAGDRSAAECVAAEFEVAPPAATHRQPNRGALQRLRWALDAQYLNVHGVVTSANDRARAISYFEKHDLIWVQNARTPNLLQVWRWPRGHLDVDDLPSGYLERVVETTGGLARWKAHALRMLLQRRERRLGDRFSTISVCSAADRSRLHHRGVHVIPNGFPLPRIPPPAPAPMQPPRIGFIGLYTHAPNRDGVQWFLETTWPAIRRMVPSIRLRIIGRDSDGPLRPVAPGVDPLGWLADPADEIATWSAMIVPLRFGAGTRIKLVEAFSRKCPVVSTRFGAYGYEVRDGRHLLLADQPDDFARACVRLIREPEFARGLTENAWHEFLKRWTWNAIAPRVWAAAEDCLKRSGAGTFAHTGRLVGTA